MLFSPPHVMLHRMLCMIFSRQIFLMLYSLNWANFTAWLSLLFEILGNMCIVIVCFPVCHPINFQINLSSCFFPWSKKSEQKLKYLQNKKSFLGEIKSIFHYFYRAFSCTKLSKTYRLTVRHLNGTIYYHSKESQDLKSINHEKQSRTYTINNNWKSITFFQRKWKSWSYLRVLIK